MKISEENADKVLKITESEKILLFLWKKKEDEYPTSRNIYKITNDKLIWRVRSEFDKDSGLFTNIWFNNEALHAYRWDGGEYSIDIKTGFATPLTLLK